MGLSLCYSQVRPQFVQAEPVTLQLQESAWNSVTVNGISTGEQELKMFRWYPAVLWTPEPHWQLSPVRECFHQRCDLLNNLKQMANLKKPGRFCSAAVAQRPIKDEAGAGGPSTRPHLFWLIWAGQENWMHALSIKMFMPDDATVEDL